jgi:hypothetical protein
MTEQQMCSIRENLGCLATKEVLEFAKLVGPRSGIIRLETTGPCCQHGIMSCPGYHDPGPIVAREKMFLRITFDVPNAWLDEYRPFLDILVHSSMYTEAICETRPVKYIWEKKPGFDNLKEALKLFFPGTTDTQLAFCGFPENCRLEVPNSALTNKVKASEAVSCIGFVHEATMMEKVTLNRTRVTFTVPVGALLSDQKVLLALLKTVK